jgi:DNA polymerase-1
VSEKPVVVLVDGFGLIFRAYHALPPSMATASGEQTNAVYGFASMLLDVLNQRKPTYAVVALEKGHTFRHEAYEGYKANRGEMPEDLREQVSRVRELIGALRIPIEERDGYEADDVIGSLSRELPRDHGLSVVVVTGDSDLLQLVDEDVLVVLPGARRFGDVREFDIPAVHERYGFGPELVPDYKALVGDTSDNIPGVPGIGDKTAKALISQYGPIEEIFAHLDEVTPTRARNALHGTDEQARKSKELATIVRDLNIDLDLDESHVGRYDRDAVAELFRELEFRSLLQKLPATIGPDGKARPAKPKPKEVGDFERNIVTNDEQLEQMAKRVGEAEAIAVDVETDSKDPMQANLVGIAVATAPREAFYVPVGHNDGDQVTLERARVALNPAFQRKDLKLYTHHGKYDLQVLTRHGFDDRPIDFDTMIAGYLLGDTSLRLKDMAFQRLGKELTEITELIGTGRGQSTMDTVDYQQAGLYACADVEATFGLVEPLRHELEERDQLELLKEIELPLVPILMAMERAGVAIDVAELEHFSEELTTRLAAIEVEVEQIAGHELKISSNKQLGDFLFVELALPKGRKTKTGYSVDESVLEGLTDQHPIPGLVLEYRLLSKLKSTYVDALPREVNPQTGRVHTSYNQTVAATGRLSSQHPNLQNIPIRTELGRRVRRAFIADHRPEHRLFEDATLLAADYSQFELRILADMSGEPFLIDAFKDGEDVHRATAALVAGVQPEDVTPNMRRIAKTVNFGILYGMQAFGLSRDTGMSRADSQAFIDQYWARLPNVKSFFDEILRFGGNHGYVQTLMGRRRYLPELHASNGARRQAAQRMAMNMPIQGTQADMMKLAMIRLDQALKAQKLPARIILQVHDELVLEVAKDQLEPTARVLKQSLETGFDLAVPLVIEMRQGQNWEDMAPLEIEPA